MAFENLARLEEQLEELQRRGDEVDDADLRRRVVAFAKQVYAEIDRAFEGVYEMLSAIVNARSDQLTSERYMQELLEKIDYSHSREKFKIVLEVCDKLDLLAKEYRPDIDRVLRNETGSYSELFWLLDKHEGMFRWTIESAVDNIAAELRARNLQEAQKLAEEARSELRHHLDRVRRANIAISGKAGGIKQILHDDARADKTLRDSAWFNGSFYLATTLLLLSLLTFVAGRLALAQLTFVVVGALVGVTMIGAFQLRNDDKLSERAFLDLLRMAFVRILLPVATRGKSGTEP